MTARTLSAHGGVGGRLPDVWGEQGFPLPHCGTNPHDAPVSSRPAEPGLTLRMLLEALWSLTKYLLWCFGLFASILLIGFVFAIIFGFTP